MPVGTYELPRTTEANEAFRNLQLGGATGLQGLMTRDTTAKRKAFEDASYAGQAEGINSAADLQRRQMLEGTFGRGVGSSSITVDLAGRLGQEQNDALARARREAMLAAGAEDRADLASELGVNNAAFGAGTTGLQGDANVALANLSREQQESQFGRNLAFQGSEGAANRSQQANLFGQNLGFQREQLAQQGSQFGQNLAFQGSENAANRSHQTGLAERGYAFQGSENAASRALQQALASQGYAFQGGQNDANRALQQALATQGYEFQGGENAANRALQQLLAESQMAFTGSENAANRSFTGEQNAAARALQQLLAEQQMSFTGSENAANRDLSRWQTTTSQDFTGGQNALNRGASMDQLMLQLAAQQAQSDGRLTAAGISSGLSGVGQLLGPLLNSWMGGK